MLSMVKRLRDLHVTPGGLSFLRLQRLLGTRKLSPQYGAAIASILDGLFQ
jgi:hypothetical protein